MNNNLKYVPILKAKKGEFDALGDLSSTQKAKIMPVIEVLNIPWNYELDEQERTIDKHLEKFAENVEKSWRAELPFFVDLPESLFVSTMIDNRHALTYIFDDFRSKKLQAVPILGLNRPAAYKEAVKEIVVKDKRGVCLRIEKEDFQDPNINKIIQDLISELDQKPNTVDVLLDFGDILAGQEGILCSAVNQQINSLPNINEWRNLIFSASSFPKTLSEFSRNSIKSIPRTEWLIQELIIKNKKEFSRLPVYSDYAISHPEIVEIDPRVMLMSANIRYTSDSEWIIVKGENTRKNGFGQFSGLCKTLSTLKEYKGRAHCLGDAYIDDCKDGKVTSGNASTWRWIGVIHHLIFVLDQLSNLHVS